MTRTLLSAVLMFLSAGCHGSSGEQPRAPDPAASSADDAGAAGLGRTTDASSGSIDDSVRPEMPDGWRDPGVGLGYRPWTAEELETFNRLSTGGRLLPTDWFNALELPDRAVRWVDAGEFLHQYAGLAIDPANGLPFGLTETYISETYLSPLEATGWYVGVNCAFCHVGEIHYNGSSMLIPGGSGRIDIQRFNLALLASLQATANDWGNSGGKFWRFWSSVSTYNLTPQQLWTALQTFITSFEEIAATPNVVEGFGRSDTTSKGASAFSYYDSRNQTTIDGPVSIPSLWDTHRYDYRHYSGSIRQALARDVQATIGGGVGIQLEAGSEQFHSSVDLEAIYEIETLLSFLEPPPWPADMLGPIDETRVARGRWLYAEHCASCHLGSPDGEGGLTLEMVSLAELGTDPVAATKLAETWLYLDRVGVGSASGISAIDAFRVISDGVIERQFDEMGLTTEDRQAFTEGGRPNIWRAPLAYRATPLLGIWATPPYLHNGSVPTIYDLLLPASERPARFRICVDTNYDPERIGLDSGDARERCRVLDTEIDGNRNSGHEYGIDLSLDERYDLIEYIKTL